MHPYLPREPVTNAIAMREKYKYAAVQFLMPAWALRHPDPRDLAWDPLADHQLPS